MTEAEQPEAAGAGTEKDKAQQTHDPAYPEKFVQFMRSGWRDTELPVTLTTGAPNHAARRARLAATFPGDTLVIPSGHEQVRANDTNYTYRPGSDFFWLTGEFDPESVLVIRPDGEAVLYVRPRSPRTTDEFFTDRLYGELWIGRRHTLSEKSTELGVATANLADLPGVLAGLAPNRTRVLRGFDPRVDKAVLPVLEADGKNHRDAELAWTISEHKLVKDAWEIAQLQDAIDATTRGFEDVARIIPADRAVSERLIEGVFGLRARHDGNDVGYTSIVGSDAHATILHWIRNDGRTEPGKLLLMDMGVENRNLYTADITRTIPVSGRFTPLQKQVYDIVHASQQAGMDFIKPGVKFTDVHTTCMRVLAEGLADLGILPCSVDEAMEKDSMIYRRWTLHGFGHMLGLDVHDCANARNEAYRDGELDEGYVLTVEPGLYFQAEDELVPAELRGVGVRIEDDVMVTAEGCVNLSAGLPRTSAEVENWLGAQREAGPRLP
ncbi:Xaa-Pro aminopeptidase [Allocatelliglobosispora scoriae]|uniref:Xaa-Pro aminopeptidase n=1 Tax=Allocatelliglobosispora scoriae TaxID=643052 RepID=A0A841BY79_9ACTN|nr:aminopeptidase P family protein [Allocatelliglobosispora scoriae]MBB5873114.1 Xaa-Pro aminopeptidase [Allocatelliglobosispora scoriae]